MIIRTLAEAMAAMKAASESAESVILETPPDAIYYAGSLYILDIFKKAQTAYPHVKAEFIFDCGDAGAEVIAAMQDGHKTIKSSAKPETRAKLKAIALGHGVNFIETAG
jgi:hypothetical protein